MKSKHWIVCLSLFLAPLLCAASELSLVPLPQQVKVQAGPGFVLNDETTIVYQGEGARKSAELLAAALRPATGLPLKVGKATTFGNNTILLRLRGDQTQLGDEGYALQSSAKGVLIVAPKPAGVFYGTQTLLQLLPTDVFRNEPIKAEWTVPAVTISDQPEFPWRGMMLDVSRYFLNKEYVKRYIDMMAQHKLNVLHWHLIDDCGWRIEIKKYPKLTEIGAKRGSGEYYHEGFYTQEDIREVVAYAAARNVEIVPEIEIPAHTLSALCAYPWLGCTGKQFTVPDRHSISPEIYCAGKESTYEFLEDVMDEIVELFPSKWIHIGGDEAKYQRWAKCEDCQTLMRKEGFKREKELQGYMTRRVENYVAKKGKAILGWAEVLECGVSTKTGIMAWHKPHHAVDGAKEGHPVVACLVRHTYFDTPESKLPGEPPCATWTPPVSLEKAYDWHPVPREIAGTSAEKNILGPNGAIWTDQFLHARHVLHDKPGEGTTRSEAYVDYLSLPRMAALAEVGWTKQELRDYNSFTERMKRMYPRYTSAGYNFRMPTPLLDIDKQPGGSIKVSGTSLVEGGTVRYTLAGSKPNAASPELDEAVTVTRTDIFKAATLAAGGEKLSLVYTYDDGSKKYAKHGKIIGEWKSGEPGNGKPKEMVFNATGFINANGEYIITFLYTGGRQRLDIDGVEVVKNDVETVARDIHHGFTGGSKKDNTYRIKIESYETGASFKVKAQVYGDSGDDTNGVVLIRPVT